MTEKMAGKFYKRMFLAAALILALFLAGCSGIAASNGKSREAASKTASGADLKVHFIDVGQGDSTLIEKDGHYMLIDAGERDQGQAVVSYLKEQGVKTLDYVIGTHPHSDHIGGLEAVIQAFDIETVIMPEKAHTTKMYERLLDAIEEKNLKITLPKPGTSYDLGSATFQILAPNGDYGDALNNWSVGIRVDYGNNSFVLCGDAEKEAEKDMIANGLSLKADVLKVSHHGSSTSSSEAFIDLVNPRYAVISCGKNNDYGHPHKETLELLQKKNINVLRTDQLGTIVAVSDGTDVTFPGVDNMTEQKTGKENTAEAETSGAADSETPGVSSDDPDSTATRQEYVVNTNTKKFHLPECSSAVSIKEKNRNSIIGTRDELIEMGYEPCKICNP